MDDDGFASSGESQDVHERAMALAVPEHQPHRGFRCHRAVLRGVIIEVLSGVTWPNHTDEPRADVVSGRGVGAEHFDSCVASVGEVSLHSFVSPVRVTDDHGQLPGDDPIQADPNLRRKSYYLSGSADAGVAVIVHR